MGKFAYMCNGLGWACDIKQKRTQEPDLNIKFSVRNHCNSRRILYRGLTERNQLGGTLLNHAQTLGDGVG